MNHLATLQPGAIIAGTEPKAGPREWAVFLKPLVASVRNPPSADEFRAKISAIAFALPDVPARFLAAEWRQRDAMRRFAFWPAAADLAEWLAPDLAAARDTRGRTAEAAAISPPTRPDARTAEEIAAVKAKVAALKTDMATGTPDRPKLDVCAAYLTGPQLLASLEREIARGGDNAALKARAKALRQRMGGDA
jgi:hypothetical protein